MSLCAVTRGEPSASVEFGHKAKHFLDGRVEIQEPGNTFTCTDRIWAAFLVRGLEAGKNHLVIHWQGPGGEVLRSRKITRHDRIADEQAWVSAYLALEGSSGLESVMDPRRGLRTLYRQLAGAADAEWRRSGQR